MISRFRRSRKEPGIKRVNNPTDKGLASLPEDILYLIIPCLTYLDRFRLKVAGSHSITTFISTLPRPSFDEYVAQLDSHTSKAVVTKTDTEKALHNACVVGYDALVLKLISKYLNLRSYKLLESCLTTAISSQQKSIVPVLLKYIPLGPFSVLASQRSSHRRFQGPTGMKNTVVEAAIKYAAVNNSVWAVQLLVEHGALATSEGGLYGLWKAASCGYEDVVAILSKRIQWQKHNDVLVALNCATENGHEGTVKILLRTGVEMSRKYEDLGAIHLAAREGQENILKLLLTMTSGDYYVHSGLGQDYDYRVYTLDASGRNDDSPVTQPRKWSCLHFAVHGRNYETVKFLLENESVSSQDGRRWDYPKRTAEALPLAAHRGDANIVDLLLSKGFDVSTKLGGKCALELAARKGHTDVMALLMDAGISLTVYHLLNAAASGSVLAVSLLLDRGADVNAKSHVDHNTPLHIAVKHHHPEVVHLLLRSGAKTDITNRYGWTPLNHIITGNQEECFNLLLESRTGTDASSGATIRHWKSDIQPALVLAMKYKRIHMIPRVLEFGADINGADSDGKMAFHEAAAMGDVDMLGTLLAAGADRHARDAQKQSALHCAARWDYGGKAVAKLLSWGLDTDARDSGGKVPLHLVQHESAAYKSLIAHGADHTAVDDKGVSVYECQRLSYYTHNCA